MSKYAGIRTDPNGTYSFVVDLPAVNGRRRQARRRGFPTKAAAHTARLELEGKGRAGELVEASRLTVDAYLDRWLESLPAAGLRPTTIDQYEKVLRRYVRPVIGGARLQTVTALEVDTITAQMAARGLSPATMRLCRAVLHRAFKDATQKGLVIRNVVSAATIPAVDRAAQEMPVWSPTELAAFLDAVDGSPHFPLIRLAALTGMRRGELCGLGWQSVDLEAQMVTVSRAAVVNGHAVGLGPVKTARARRRIDIDDETCDVLRRHRVAQLEKRLLMGIGWRSTEDLVFTQGDGAPWHPQAVTRAFARLVAKTELPAISLHGLRHSHATHLLAAGVNPRVVSERLGHSSVGFTLEQYAHVLPGQQAAAAAAAAALVAGNVTNL